LCAKYITAQNYKQTWLRLSRSTFASYLQKRIIEVKREKREWDTAGLISVFGLVFFTVQFLKPVMIHRADISGAVAAIYIVLLIVCACQSVHFKGERDGLIQELVKINEPCMSSQMRRIST